MSPVGRPGSFQRVVEVNRRELRVNTVAFIPDPPLKPLHCKLGPGAWRITGGYGGWETVARPDRTALTVWRGFEPLRLAGAVLIDHFFEDPEDRSDRCREDRQRLERMAGRGEGARDREPPVLRVEAPGESVPRQDVSWVIEALEWQEEGVIFNRAGNPVRLAATLTLLQHVEDRVLHDRSAANRRKEQRAKRSARRRRGPRRYTVRAGDTLQRIAHEQLGDADEWRELANLNGIRDPRRLRVGQVLRLPTD